jgi:hypothetical protein
VNIESLRKAVTWAVDGELFATLKVHANTSWRMPRLIVLAVLWVWSNQETLTDAFREADRWSLDLFGESALSTFQGLMGALTTWTGRILPLLRRRMHHLMERECREHFRVGRWAPIAVDGSRVSTPRTKANEAAFCSKTYGQSSKAKRRQKNRKKSRQRVARKKAQPQGPQIWTTLLWHMGLHMPWNWRNGPSTASEKRDFQQLLADETYPKNTLFCGDAGFVSYEMWKRIIDLRHAFLIRVGANARLLKGLGYVRERADLVYLWPDKMARRKQPPLALRLIRVKIGRALVALVTNVVDIEQLSDEQAVLFYRMRWGVELQFRTLKQTFGRRTLRSRTPDRALVELDWSLVGLWLIQLLAIKEQIELGKLPENCSVGLAITIIREAFDRRWEPTPHNLAHALRNAVKDTYSRKCPKAGRYQPNSGSKPSCGQPIIIRANASHKTLLQKYFATAA